MLGTQEAIAYLQRIDLELSLVGLDPALDHTATTRLIPCLGGHIANGAESTGSRSACRRRTACINADECGVQAGNQQIVTVNLSREVMGVIQLGSNRPAHHGGRRTDTEDLHIFGVLPAGCHRRNGVVAGDLHQIV